MLQKTILPHCVGKKKNFLTAVRPLVLIEHLRLAPDFHKRAAKPIAPSRLKCQFFCLLF